MVSETHSDSHSERQGDALEFSGPSTRRVLSGAALSFLMYIAFASVLLAPALDWDLAARVMGLVLDTLLVGGVCVAGLLMLRRPSPILRATHTGLTLDTVGARIGPIPWEDIKALGMVRMWRGAFPTRMDCLVLVVRDTYPLCSQPLRSVPPRMWFGWAMFKMVGGIILQRDAFQVSLEEVWQRIRERFENDMQAHGVKTAP